MPSPYGTEGVSSQVYFQSVIVARITPDEVVHEAKRLLVAGNHTCHRRPSHPGRVCQQVGRRRPSNRTKSRCCPTHETVLAPAVASALHSIGITSSGNSIARQTESGSYRRYEPFFIALHHTFNPWPAPAWLRGFKGPSHISHRTRLSYLYHKLDKHSCNHFVVFTKYFHATRDLV